MSADDNANAPPPPPPAVLPFERVRPMASTKHAPKGEKPDAAKGEKAPSNAALLVELAAVAELFKSPDGELFARVPVNKHRETWSLRTKGFRRWLGHAFYARWKRPPGAQALADALAVLEARAQFDGATAAVHVRVAPGPDGASMYLDLGDDAWNAVHVDASGWRVVADPPVRFRRPRGMLPLPVPAPGGSLAALWRFVNVAEDERALALAWLAQALNPHGPYPVLLLRGEHGSAKSSSSRYLRLLVDPNRSLVRAEPKEPRDLAIAANNSRVIALDNLSGVPAWLSDALCRLATGGGFATRELYSDDEETIFEAQRPIIINGIEDVARAPDLLDRALTVTLPAIPDGRRAQERELAEEFEAARAGILGALLDALAGAFARRPATRLATLPRMADFAVFAVAAEPGLGLAPGAFLEAYDGNRAAANAQALEDSPVTEALRTFVAGRAGWTGSATELLAALTSVASDAAKRQRAWPSKPNVLSGALRRITPNLRAVGIAVTFDRAGHGGPRKITLANSGVAPEGTGDSPSPPPPPSPPAELRGNVGDDRGDDPGAVQARSSPDNASGFNANDDGDAGDDESRHLQNEGDARDDAPPRLDPATRMADLRAAIARADAATALAPLRAGIAAMRRVVGPDSVGSLWRLYNERAVELGVSTKGAGAA